MVSTANYSYREARSREIMAKQTTSNVFPRPSLRQMGRRDVLKVAEEKCFLLEVICNYYICCERVSTLWLTATKTEISPQFVNNNNNNNNNKGKVVTVL
jgi:hypothetical protein